MSSKNIIKYIRTFIVTILVIAIVVTPIILYLKMVPTKHEKQDNKEKLRAITLERNSIGYKIKELQYSSTSDAATKIADKKAEINILFTKLKKKNLEIMRLKKPEYKGKRLFDGWKPKYDGDELRAMSVEELVCVITEADTQQVAAKAKCVQAKEECAESLDEGEFESKTHKLMDLKRINNKIKEYRSKLEHIKIMKFQMENVEQPKIKDLPRLRTRAYSMGAFDYSRHRKITATDLKLESKARNDVLTLCDEFTEQCLKMAKERPFCLKKYKDVYENVHAVSNFIFKRMPKELSTVIDEYHVELSMVVSKLMKLRKRPFINRTLEALLIQKYIMLANICEMNLNEDIYNFAPDSSAEKYMQIELARAYPGAFDTMMGAIAVLKKISNLKPDKSKKSGSEESAEHPVPDREVEYTNMQLYLTRCLTLGVRPDTKFLIPRKVETIEIEKIQEILSRHIEEYNELLEDPLKNISRLAELYPAISHFSALIDLTKTVENFEELPEVKAAFEKRADNLMDQISGCMEDSRTGESRFEYRRNKDIIVLTGLFSDYDRIRALEMVDEKIFKRYEEDKEYFRVEAYETYTVVFGMAMASPDRCENEPDFVKKFRHYCLMQKMHNELVKIHMAKEELDKEYVEMKTQAMFNFRQLKDTGMMEEPADSGKKSQRERRTVSFINEQRE